jgi:hypothetical protein
VALAWAEDVLMPLPPPREVAVADAWLAPPPMLVL